MTARRVVDSRRSGLRVARRAGAGLLLVAALVAARCSDEQRAPFLVAPPIPEGVDDLRPLLEDVRARFRLPGMVAAVFDADGLRAVGAAGTRKVGSGVPLLYTDRLQIASIAKTMTATLVAKLIEDERLTWETTLAEIYPELVATMAPEMRQLTVESLLRHRAGLRNWMRNDDAVEGWVRRTAGLSNRQRRYEAVEYILSQPPEFTPGERYGYTNDAYLILGNVCEQVTDRNFDELLLTEVAVPLRMSSLDFRDPGRDLTVERPWGHVWRGYRFVPYEPASTASAQRTFATPYGAGVSASVIDLANYGAFHLRGDTGGAGVLKADSFRRLHHAPAVDVPPATQVPAAGFFNEGRVDADGRWLNVQHWGYYGRGRTLLWFSPQANVGAVVLTNGTDEEEGKGMRPISEVVIALFRRYRSSTAASIPQ